jgi:hypothetical protein
VDLPRAGRIVMVNSHASRAAAALNHKKSIALQSLMVSSLAFLLEYFF